MPPLLFFEEYVRLIFFCGRGLEAHSSFLYVDELPVASAGCDGIPLWHLAVPPHMSAALGPVQQEFS